MKVFRKIIIVLLFLIDVMLIAFASFVSQDYKAVNVDNYIKSNDKVEVKYIDNDMYFSPKENSKNIGLIFYSGALVEKEAYAPIMNKLAQKGFIAVLANMPYKLAFFGINKADKIIENNSNIDWYIGGHSLGGAMSSSYYFNHSDKLEGLVLLAGYSTRDLTTLTNPYILSIFGSNDEVLNRKSYDENRHNIKLNLYEFEIKGANHSGFASYGAQKGDGESTISKSEQWDITTNYISLFMTHSF